MNDLAERNNQGLIVDRDGATGYRGHFTGAWICYTCGAYCDPDVHGGDNDQD